MMLTHKGTQTIETERLILRRFRVEDAQAMYDNWASDIEVTKYMTWPTHGNVEDSRAILTDWVQGYEKADSYLWAIALKEKGDQPIGSISVVAFDERSEKAEIGYCIGKSWWHRGIMTEALRAVMSYLFDEVGFQRLEACHDVNNPNSGAVMRKCGMICEGILRRSGHNNQGICDLAIYAQLSNER